MCWMCGVGSRVFKPAAGKEKGLLLWGSAFQPPFHGAEARCLDGDEGQKPPLKAEGMPLGSQPHLLGSSHCRTRPLQGGTFLARGNAGCQERVQPPHGVRRKQAVIVSVLILLHGSHPARTEPLLEHKPCPKGSMASQHKPCPKAFRAQGLSSGKKHPKTILIAKTTAFFG